MAEEEHFEICLNNICLAYANVVLVQFSCVFSSVAALFSFLIQHLTAGDACQNTNSHFLSSIASDNLTLSNNNGKIEYTKLLIVLFHQASLYKKAFLDDTPVEGSKSRSYKSDNCSIIVFLLQTPFSDIGQYFLQTIPSISLSRI